MNYLMTKTSGRCRMALYSFAAGHNHQLLDLKTGKLLDLEVAPFWQVRL